MKTFRDVMVSLGPSWLVSLGDGAKTIYVASLLIDASLEKMRQALVARFPELAETETALPYLGRDRQVPRGRGEPADRYASRLVAWRYPFGHRVRGNAWSLLDQIRNYFFSAGGSAQATIDRRGNLRAMASDGTQTKDAIGTVNFDGNTAWARFLVVVDARASGVKDDGVLIGDPDLWGGTLGPDMSAYAIGLAGASQGDVNAIRASIKQNKPAGTQCAAVLWLADPTNTDTVSNVLTNNPPDGSWADVDGGTMPAHVRRMRP